MESHYIVQDGLVFWGLLPLPPSNYRHMTYMPYKFCLLEFKNVLKLLLKIFSPLNTVSLEHRLLCIGCLLPLCSALLSAERASAGCRPMWHYLSLR